MMIDFYSSGNLTRHHHDKSNVSTPSKFAYSDPLNWVVEHVNMMLV